VTWHLCTEGTEHVRTQSCLLVQCIRQAVVAWRVACLSRLHYELPSIHTSISLSPARIITGIELPDSIEISPQAPLPYAFYKSSSCGIQLWGTASTSNIEILERSQSKALGIIVDAPRYVPNNHIRRDLQMTSVKEEICRSSNQYCTRLATHPNVQILTLMESPGTGVCEDTCQTICLTDFYCGYCTCNSSF
jgi:hypothetical protein